MRSFDCWEPQLSKKYRVDRSPTIFQGQQYSSCSKAGGCRATQPLGGFRRDLLIVSRVAPTPEGTANFPGNWYSQPLILRPFGRSAQELSVEYQVQPLFINFSSSTAEKGYRKKPGSGNLRNPYSKQRFQSHGTSTKIIRKSHRKNQLFMCLPLACFETGFGFVSGFEEG
jgi:hypothetical protein